MSLIVARSLHHRFLKRLHIVVIRQIAVIVVVLAGQWQGFLFSSTPPSADVAPVWCDGTSMAAKVIHPWAIRKSVPPWRSLQRWQAAEWAKVMRRAMWAD